MGNVLQRITPKVEDSTAASSNVKAQSQADSDIYSLVRAPSYKIEDRGILVTEAANAFKTKDYSKLRETIRDKLKEYAYNGGGGRNIPIKSLVEARNSERKEKTKQNDSRVTSMLRKQASAESIFAYTGRGSSEPDSDTRICCWDVEKRGALGETALHICLLNNTNIHDILAKEIVKVYPNMLHDIYLGDEYYGESVLHMAIANENIDMLKFILEKGKDVGLDFMERCCGKFFCPFDQATTRHDVPNCEVVAVSKETNYKGLVYWGEYPLSFAACSNQPEAVKILLKAGADILAKDINGNNVLHLMVIHNNQSLFDLCYEKAGDKKDTLLEDRNNQGLTPLTLSAKLANKEMLDHIMELKREISWIFGDVTCAYYPLSDIDTIDPQGQINGQSALSIILSAESKAHLSMLDGLLYQLLHEKWKQYAKVRFYERAALFILFLSFFVTAVYLQPPQREANVSISATENATIKVDSCYLLAASDGVQILRFVFECFSVVGAIIYTVLACLEVHYEGAWTFLHTIQNAPMKGSFLISCTLIISLIPCRFTCSVVAENVILTLAICTCIPYLLFFCRGFKLVGPFIVAIYKMITGDLLRFLLIYIVFLMGFSQAMYVLFRGVDHPLFSYPFLSILGMFVITLGEFSDLYRDFDQLRNPSAAKLLFFIYMVLVTVLLINVLIAMMGSTFNTIAETRWEWQRQWAKIVLVMEQSVHPEHRKKKQQRYSQPLDDNTDKRWFVVRNFKEKKS